LDAITPRHLEQLRDHLAARTSAATANGKLKILRMAFKSAVRDKILTDNPAAAVSAAKTRPTVRREFSAAEIELLLPALTGEWRALFFMGLFTGQRLNDLALLRWHQVDLGRATVAFVARKTRATVSLPLVPQIIDALSELPSSDDPRAPVFPRLAAMAQPSRSSAFREILAGVGLADPVPRAGASRGLNRSRRTSELSFHSLRHTATTMLKAAGVADSIARAIIGHESAAVSRVYTHLDMATMRTALMRMAGAGDPD
jgi:integrase